MPEPRRILFIEADEEWRAMGIEYLREGGFGPKDGYVIVELSNVETGFATIERDGDFIAVITAWKNPDPAGRYSEFNGLELLRKLRTHKDEKLRKLPVIIHTVDRSCERVVSTISRATVHPKMVSYHLPDTLKALLETASA